MGPVRFMPDRVGGPTGTLLGVTPVAAALVALSAGVFDVTPRTPLAGQRYAGRPVRSHRRTASPLSPWRVEGRPS